MVGLLRLRFPLALVLCLSGLTAGAVGALDAPKPTSQSVLIIPIHGTIDEGMAHLVMRAVDAAQRDGSSAIILDVNTFGGLVSSATEIRDALLASRVRTIAYVSERAWSAGALVTLSAQRIAMAPASSIGAAEPIPKTVKTVSALRGEFESTASRNHRDPRIAAAMVDVNADAPQYKKTGAILTLKAEDAKRAGIADSIDPALADVLSENHLANASTHTADYTFAEQLARFATSPEVSGLLLTLGMLGLLIEMQTLHGIAGAIGVGSLALFFGTHVYAGFSNSLVILLAVLGLLGILYELHVVPGHGAPGILGGIALLLAVLLAFGVPFFFVAVQSIAMAIVLTVIFFWLATKVFPENAWMRRLTFAGAQGAEYVTSSDFSLLRHSSGVAASFLRPAGIATIDGKRVDVLTEGDFIPAGTPIRVTRVEGARVFVAPLELPSRKD